MSLCILNLDRAPGIMPDGSEYLSLGQRAMSKFPFYAIFDRETNSAEMQLGGATELGGPQQVGVQVAIAVVCVGILVTGCIYLIYLRKLRLEAEDWLDKNRHFLLTHAKGLMEDDDIIDKIANGKDELHRKFE